MIVGWIIRLKSYKLMSKNIKIQTIGEALKLLKSLKQSVSLRKSLVISSTYTSAYEEHVSFIKKTQEVIDRLESLVYNQLLDDEFVLEDFIIKKEKN